MAKITTRAAGLGACAALLAGLGGLVGLARPAATGASSMTTEPGQRYSLTGFRDHAGAARRTARLDSRPPLTITNW